MQVAMDLGQLFFDYNSETDTFVMKILDPSIHASTMRQATAALQQADGAQLPHSLADVTFAELEGQPLKFLACHTPAMRCMNFKARLAVLTAEERGWVTPGTVHIQDYASEGSYKATMDMFFESMRMGTGASAESV